MRSLLTPNSRTCWGSSVRLFATQQHLLNLWETIYQWRVKISLALIYRKKLVKKFKLRERQKKRAKSQRSTRKKMKCASLMKLMSQFTIQASILDRISKARLSPRQEPIAARKQRWTSQCEKWVVKSTTINWPLLASPFANPICCRRLRPWIMDTRASWRRLRQLLPLRAKIHSARFRVKILAAVT